MASPGGRNSKNRPAPSRTGECVITLLGALPGSKCPINLMLRPDLPFLQPLQERRRKSGEVDGFAGGGK